MVVLRQDDWKSRVDNVLGSRALLVVVALVTALTFCLGPASSHYDIRRATDGVVDAVCHVGLSPVKMMPPALVIQDTPIDAH